MSLLTDEFKLELQQLLNKHSVENICDTPDFILAQSICDQLEGMAGTIRRRDAWYNFKPFGGNDVRSIES